MINKEKLSQINMDIQKNITCKKKHQNKDLAKVNHQNDNQKHKNVHQIPSLIMSQLEQLSNTNCLTIRLGSMLKFEEKQQTIHIAEYYDFVNSLINLIDMHVLRKDVYRLELIEIYQYWSTDRRMQYFQINKNSLIFELGDKQYKTNDNNKLNKEQEEFETVLQYKCHDLQILSKLMEFIYLNIQSNNCDHKKIKYNISMNKYSLSSPGNLFIKGIPKNLNVHDLLPIFEKFGKILSFKIILDKNFMNSHESLGYGFLNYEFGSQASDCIKNLNGAYMNDSLLFINYHVERKERKRIQLSHFKEGNDVAKFRGVFIGNLPLYYNDDTTTKKIVTPHDVVDKVLEILIDLEKIDNIEVVSYYFPKSNSGTYLEYDNDNDELLENLETCKRQNELSPLKGYGFIKFKTHVQALDAIKYCNNFEWMSQTLVVNKAIQNSNPETTLSCSHDADTENSSICGTENCCAKICNRKHTDFSNTWTRSNVSEPLVISSKPLSSSSSTFSERPSSQSESTSSEKQSNHSSSSSICSIPVSSHDFVSEKSNNDKKQTQDKAPQVAYQKQNFEPLHIPPFFPIPSIGYLNPIDHHQNFFFGPRFSPPLVPEFNLNNPPIMNFATKTQDSSRPFSQNFLPIPSSNEQESNLYVKNIPLNWSDQDFTQFYQKFGEIISAKVITVGGSTKVPEKLATNETEPEMKEINEQVEIDSSSVSRRTSIISHEKITENQGKQIEDEELHGAREKQKGSSKGYGFVCFKNPLDASKAMFETNGIQIRNPGNTESKTNLLERNVLTVSFAAKRHSSKSSPNSYSHTNLGVCNESHVHNKKPSYNIKFMRAIQEQHRDELFYKVPLIVPGEIYHNDLDSPYNIQNCNQLNIPPHYPQIPHSLHNEDMFIPTQFSLPPFAMPLRDCPVKMQCKNVHNTDK